MASDEQTLPRPAERRSWTSVLYDPAIRGVVFQLALGDLPRRLLLVDRQQHDRQPAARQHRLRLRLPRNRAGFEILTVADPLQLGFDLWPRLPRRPPQHALRRRPRHHLRDHPRLHRRHRAAVAQLAGPQDRDRLRRDLPQHPAAAAAAVLVQGGALRAAGAARRACSIFGIAFSAIAAWSSPSPIVEPAPARSASPSSSPSSPASCSRAGRAAASWRPASASHVFATCR